MTVSLAEARERVLKRATRFLRVWAADPDAADAMTISLAPPSEREVLDDWDGVVRWARSWEGVSGVERASRRWPSAGTQTVPIRIVLTDVQAMVDFAGLSGRLAALRKRLSSLRTVVEGRHAASALVVMELTRLGGAIESLSEPDFARLLGVLSWLADNDTSGRRIRELPIRGVDTKWVGAHQGLVTRLGSLITGRDSLGFEPNPALVRVRFLDPELAPAGIGYAAMPVDELARRSVEPAHVLIVENLETMLALPESASTVALHGSGYGIGAWAPRLRWVRSSQALYWGDLDSHGFAILNELRASGVAVKSVLMDEATLLAHRDLWVPEPKPNRGVLTHLTEDELAVVELLTTEGSPRLEQERIPLAHALIQLRAAGLPIGSS